MVCGRVLWLAAPVARASVPVMKAAAPAVSEWADPVAGHGSALSIDNVPFDPLGLASKENLVAYREAEIKHGRVAMLAALGWPAAEELEPFFSKLFGLEDELIETGAPNARRCLFLFSSVHAAHDAASRGITRTRPRHMR